MTRKQALARLGLRENADAEEIKHAYRKMAFELHPDLHADNPNAGKEFQLLNEAYVLLTSPNAGSSAGRPHGQSRTQARAEATERARADAKRAYERAKKRFQETRKNSDASGPNARPDPDEASKEAKRNEMLRDLLHDPFARRVFEDIYRQIREESTRNREIPPKKTTQEPGFLEKTADNVSDWFRRQIDEDQTIKVAGPLTPGKRIRLQIHSGVFGKTQTIELTLPPQFEPGKPLRLKGLGKRLGKWHGDLYLRIVNQ